MLKNVIELVLILYWSTLVTKADSYYTPYLLVALAGVFCFVFNKRSTDYSLTSRQWRITHFFAIVLASTVVLANYKLFIGCADGGFACIVKIISGILLFLGGRVLFQEILFCIYHKGFLKTESYTYNRVDKWVLLIGWFLLATVNSIILFGAKYPGLLTFDSFKQLSQILTNTYSNHHPYYHTQIIRLFFNIGYRLFGDVNAAVATYNVFSIIVMAFCFSYCVYTIWQITRNKMLALFIYLWYMLMPYHMIYSFTVWKDVLFGAAVTFFVIGCYRIVQHIGRNNMCNIFVMICGAFGMCLLRSNGWIAFVLSTVCFLLSYGKSYKKISLIFIGVIVTTFILKQPVLDALHVTQPDMVESLSIPIQQIARVIAEENEITDEQKELLNQVIDVEKIPETYNNRLSDPIKELIRAKDNQEYIQSHIPDFIKLYVQLGLRYPHLYIESWIDQTRGYWNAGYDYWKWANEISENTFGIETTIKSDFVHRIFTYYFYMWKEFPILELFMSIGLCTWLVLISTYVAIMRKNRISLFISILFLSILFSLLIATPVWAEFRYAYALFCGIPFIIVVSLDGNRKSKTQTEETFM